MTNKDYELRTMISDAVKSVLSETTLKVRLENDKSTGKWIIDEKEGDKIWYCHCSECNTDPQDYVGGTENWWLIELPKFCPHCGSRNEEVVEMGMLGKIRKEVHYWNSVNKQYSNSVLARIEEILNDKRET